MTEEQVAREHRKTYRCRCVLTMPNQGSDHDGRCGVYVNPDQPFCVSCVTRHVDDEWVQKGAVLVSYVPLSEP